MSFINLKYFLLKGICKDEDNIPQGLKLVWDLIWPHIKPLYNHGQIKTGDSFVGCNQNML